MNITTSFGRRRIAVRRSFLAATTILAAGIIAPATAQMTPPAPVHQSVDANGVDLFAGTLNVKAPAISIGGGRGQGLSYYRINKGSGWTDNITAALDQNGSMVTVRMGGSTDAFTVSGSTFTSTQGNGATLTQSGTTYTYTASNGTVAHFSSYQANSAPYYASLGRAMDIIRPSGMKLVYNYSDTEICTRSKEGSSGQICLQHGYIHRLANVTNSYGYQIILSYQSDDTGEDEESGAGGLNLGPWSTVATASVVNAANYGAGQATESIATGATATVTDAMNRTTSYRMTSDWLRVAGITRPGASSESVTIGYDGNNRVASVANASGTWSYSKSDNGDVRTVTVTAPSNVATTYVFSIASQQMTSVTDGLGHISSWSYDGSGRVLTATAPEQNSVTYTYDGRGNVTDTTYTPKPGSGQTAIATHAAYDPTCGNTVTCNQPNTTTDANGNVTSYSYDPTHGGVTVVTQPAGANGVQPQARYGYTAYTDYLGGTIYRQTSSSTCRTQASSACTGTSDEVVTTTNYGSLSGNNFLPLSTTKRAGDNSVSATASMGYDGLGNMTSSTDPVGAVTSYAYDAGRELTETISADPDGGGPLKPRAVRLTYNADGTVATKEAGTDTGGNFQSLQTVTSNYDSYGRKVQDTLSAGGTSFGVSQYGYDGMGRLLCTTTRMNPATFTSPPGACTPGTGGADPDRITLYDYDALSRVQKVTTGYGSNVQADAARATYSVNGKTATAIDANGNVTNYSYDGFDRLTTTTYPGGSYEQLTLDSNGQATARRLRDGHTIGYGYDALGHLTSKIRPDHQTFWETDLSYAWDNLGELVTANDGAGHALGFVYDALGRKTADTDAWYATGNATFQYDNAGRRTRMTWWDGFYVTYDYDALGEMTGIHENGGAVLAGFGYDDLGQRTSLSRANGTSTSYGYDAASRLTALTLNGGPANAYTFGYNPAGQITSRTSSNDAFAPPAGSSGTKSYATNALNQYTQAGGTALGYDGKGNLATSGSSSYIYTSENQLATGPNANLGYDALGRLFNGNIDAGLNTTLSYDDSRVIAEINQANGAVLRRYVWGPGTEEPVVWYEGSGTSDRRFLHADERGSVVAATDTNGNSLGVNSYDEYGNPGANNVGRFQYTGQKWLSGIGLYDYKTRMYSPSLGRFMQTDPIGYGDGLNWFNYVGGDPVNAKDPSGTSCTGSLFETCPSYLQSGTAASPNQAQTWQIQDLAAQGVSFAAAVAATNLVKNHGFSGALPYAAQIDALNVPQYDDPVGTVVVTYQTNRGPTFGVLDQFNGSRGVLSHATGGYDQASRDLDDLARWNGITPLGNKGLLTGPPAGWFIAPISNGIRIFTAAGLQMRVTPGSINIDIPVGFRVGPSFTDNSNFGETVHYGRQ